MPTYAYQCQSCGVQFEKVQKFTDKPLTRCPECRKGHVRRVVQPAAIVFKGSGWYATDSRSPSGAGKRAAKSDKAEASSEKSELSTSKSDTTGSKPAKSEAGGSDA